VAELPAPLRVSSPYPFVGRTDELEKLRMLLPTAEGEGRRVVLLGGEPGAGKSRLVREFAAEAAQAGALVLYGACDAVVHAPYGPFAQALERLAAVLDEGELRDALGASAGELIRLLPNLAEALGDPPPPPRADPDTERHRLHTVVTELLERVGQRRPVVLIIEDGHWADAPTLLLLAHLARAAWSGRMLLFATFRDAEAEVPATLAHTLADLRRSDDVVRLRLGGLSDGEVGEFVRRVAGGREEVYLAEIAAAISSLTSGNPFLMCELWRALVETDAIAADRDLPLPASLLVQLGAPESVREVVSARLARHAPATTELLELAATAGVEFDAALLAAASQLHERELVAALDEATRSGILVELPGRQLSYRFSHELVRRALYDRMSGARRAELHLRIGESLECSGARSVRVLADLARHFTAAAPLDGPERAIRYNVLAAEAAANALAFDEASEMLLAAEELGIEDHRQRAEVLLELGVVRHKGGKAPDALRAFAAAARIGRELGDAELLARAAAGYEDAGWRPGTLEADAVDLLEEAVVALGEQESELRVELLAGLARALDMRGQQERGAVVRAGAIELARRLGDRAGLATVLVRSYWSRGATPIGQILEMITEARTIGEELMDTEIQAEAMSWRVPAFVQMADIPAARAEVAQLRQIAEITRQPFTLHVAEHFGAAIALADGRLDAAEAMAHRSERVGRPLTGRDASGTHGIQMFSIRREQGRLAELASVIRILAADDRADGPWRPGLASLLVELGMEPAARRELARIAGEGLDPFRESLWMGSLVYTADACAALRDETVAALVQRELAPFAGAVVMVGHLVAFYGSADRYLGMLAATLGEWEQAEEHFERALEANRAMGASTWLAHTHYEYARMLVDRGGECRKRAEAMLAEADRLAGTIGMAALRNRIRALGSGAPPATPAGLPDALSAREAQILRLIARGLSNREIGAELFISEHTAANHVRSILRKTGCANRTEAASYAHRHALADA
jgi:DNA-binding CsgD family transcriptional regulator/tetratricopeptide (TPR) repeat protein